MLYYSTLAEQFWTTDGMRFARGYFRENRIEIAANKILEAYEAVESRWCKQLDTSGKGITEGALEDLDLMVLEQLAVEGDMKQLAWYVAKNWWRMEQELPPELVRRAYPDARPCLEQIARGRVKMGIVSNIESEERLRRELELIGLLGFFPVLVASGSVGKAKPALEIFQQALSGIGVPTHEIVFVGDDYEKDYLGAQAAGVRPILIDRNRKNMHRQIQCFTNLEPIPAMLANWPEAL